MGKLGESSGLRRITTSELYKITRKLSENFFFSCRNIHFFYDLFRSIEGILFSINKCRKCFLFEKEMINDYGVLGGENL